MNADPQQLRRNLDRFRAATGPWLDHLRDLAADRFPALEPTAAGLPTCKTDGRYRHSPRDPRQEAERQLARLPPAPGALTVVLGVGLGHLPRLWAERRPDQPLVGIEFDAAVLAAGLAAAEFPAPAAPGRLPWLWAGPPDYRLKRLLAALVPDSLDVRVLDLAPPAHAAAARTVQGYAADLAAEKRQDVLTRCFFAELWLTNLAANAPAFVAAPGFDALGDRYRGLPAVIVGAGPSLRPALPELRAHQDRLLLIATDTALRALRLAGVRPQLVVSVDAQPENLRDFTGVETADLTMVWEAAVYPGVLAAFRGQTLAAPKGHHLPQPDGSERLDLHPLAAALLAGLPPRPYLQAGGSVSHAAFDLARQLGCAPLILVGQDLAYPGEATHAAESYDIRDWEAMADRFATIESAAFRQLRKRDRFPVPAIGGGTIPTDAVFNQYRVWFEDAATVVGVPCRNAGTTGAAIRGFAPVTLAAAAREWGRPVPAVPALPAPRADRAAIRRGLAAAAAAADRIAARAAAGAPADELAGALTPLLREPVRELLFRRAQRDPTLADDGFRAELARRTAWLGRLLAGLAERLG